MLTLMWCFQCRSPAISVLFASIMNSFLRSRRFISWIFFYSSRPLHLKQSHLIYIHLYIKITVRKMLNYVSDDIFMPKWFICFRTPKLALLPFLYGCHYASTHVIKKAVFCKHLQNKQKQKKVFCQRLKFAVYSKRKLVNMLRNFVNT